MKPTNKKPKQSTASTDPMVEKIKRDLKITPLSPVQEHFWRVARMERLDLENHELRATVMTMRVESAKLQAANKKLRAKLRGTSDGQAL